jgi:hypothetical protein
MSPLTPQQCLHKLRAMYRNAFKREATDDQAVLDWAANPESWATWQVRQFGWSYLATEAVVRQCRILHRRAARAALEVKQ